MAEVTVVFADLTGSTGVFESLGNVKATQAITRLTQWIGKVCEQHHGQVVKYLGDGVLILFSESPHAIEAATELQRVHQERIRQWPEALKMRLQIGMARGEIVRQDGDCYGDAVNVASRLSDLSGPEQILVTDLVIRQLPENNIVRYRSMGSMPIRGRVEPCVVYRIEWQSEVLSEVFTVPASLTPSPFAGRAVRSAFIELSWLDTTIGFTSVELPVFVGRDTGAQFVVQDPRVSRKHARIEWRAGKFYLEDISSYGTWVRFADSSAIVALRRQECVLLMEGEMALGAPFEDFTVTTISFKFQTGPSSPFG
ncbi:MAG: adenylate/guanylate cyclase domain-containing protein [Pseudomonadota bacterium]|nr:adenylate/guanylate cyclase domain-containing protein [Pseudomonadota bacterium]